jgi:anti-sigma factor RsiW
VRSLLHVLRRCSGQPRAKSRRVDREDPLSSKPYITCQELIDFIASYRDNNLSPDQRVEFERHLSVCPSCVAYLKTYEQTIALARATGDDPVPADIPESLVRAILAMRQDQKS